MKKDKLIQTGKVLVTCTLTITGLGRHAGSGEEWADEENALTAAEALSESFFCHRQRTVGAVQRRVDLQSAGRPDGESLSTH